LSIARQYELLTICRSSYYYKATGETLLNLLLMRLIDEQFLETPYYGARQMARHLRRECYGVSRKRIGRLMRNMGLSAYRVDLVAILLCRGCRDFTFSANVCMKEQCGRINKSEIFTCHFF